MAVKSSKIDLKRKRRRSFRPASKEGHVDKPSSAGRKLSVAMIARNAEATIAAALASVRSIADEIIVVDTGSTDRTWELAQSRSSHLLHFPWTDDFSAARNFALSNLTGDWVLWLDSSEQLVGESARQIRETIDLHPERKVAYQLLVQLPAGAGQVDGEQIGRWRLWPRKAGLKFAGRVRETLSPPLDVAGLAQETTPWQILRSAHDVDPMVKAEKARRDLRLAEMEIEQVGPRLQLLLAMGEAWSALGEPLKAAGWFRQVIDEAPADSTDRLEAFYGLLTTFDSRPRSADEQVATCLEALQAFPLDAQLLCAMGSYLQKQGRLDLACRSYQTAVEHGQVNLNTWHLANLPDLAAMCYSMTLEMQGQSDEACRAIESSLAKRGNSDRLRRQLIDLHIKHNRRQEALAEAQRLSDNSPNRDGLRDAIRGACLAAQQQWPAAMAYLKTAYEARCRDPICLRWLAVGLMTAGDFASAEPLLRQWQATAPESPEPQRLLQQLNSQRQNAASLNDADASKPWRVDGNGLGNGIEHGVGNGHGNGNGAAAHDGNGNGKGNSNSTANGHANGNGNGNYSILKPHAGGR
jgi:tetratricopeptide (TPR) repeat protein